MAESPKNRLTLSFSSKEIFFSFIGILCVSLVVFGIGFYIGSGFQDEIFNNSEKIETRSTDKQQQLAMPAPIEEKNNPETEQDSTDLTQKKELSSQEETAQSPGAGAIASLPTELPKTLLSEKTSVPKPLTMTELFVDEKNLKTLAHVLESGSFTLRLGTFAKAEAAVEEKKRVEKFGFPSVFFCPQEDSLSVSVCLGGFEKEETAHKFASKLQAKSVIQQYHIQKLN
ncbi:MAG: SPOR domain-containing protein [Deltaproteobacteria bacterium]|nr:SPOR domain-containing protein [Deltaproteobacteria bacterium]